MVVLVMPMLRVLLVEVSRAGLCVAWVWSWSWSLAGVGRGPGWQCGWPLVLIR